MRNSPNDVTSGMTLEHLACLDPGQRRKTVEDFVRRLLSTWTESDCHEVDLNLALYKYGVDSIGAANMSLQIRNGVGAIFEVNGFEAILGAFVRNVGVLLVFLKYTRKNMVHVPGVPKKTLPV